MGCLVDSYLINHLMYTDDLVILSPCSDGSHQLLKVCTQYSFEYDIEFNAKNVMMIRSSEYKKMTPCFLSVWESTYGV